MGSVSKRMAQTGDWYPLSTFSFYNNRSMRRTSNQLNAALAKLVKMAAMELEKAEALYETDKSAAIAILHGIGKIIFVYILWGYIL